MCVKPFLILVFTPTVHTQVMSYKKHTDFISGFTMHSQSSCLLACSGDGTLSAHDLRSKKVK